MCNNSNLQTLVRCITLRRTKSSTVDGRPLVALPEKTVCVEQVELTQQERDEYELARLEGQNTISRWSASITSKGSHSLWMDTLPHGTSLLGHMWNNISSSGILESDIV